MRRRYVAFVDVAAYWTIAVLAYAVVGFLRGRELVRDEWQFFVRRRRRS